MGLEIPYKMHANYVGFLIPYSWCLYGISNPIWPSNDLIFLWLWRSFHFSCMGMVIPSWGEEGTGKIPYSSLKAHLHSRARHNFFPTCGLAVVVEKISTTPAKPRVGKKLWLARECRCAFRDSYGIFNSTTRGFAPRGGIFPSLLRLMMGLGQS